MLEGHGSRPGTPAGEDEEIKVVSGIDVLTNNQVSLLSGTPIYEVEADSWNRSTLSLPRLWHSHSHTSLDNLKLPQLPHYSSTLMDQRLKSHLTSHCILFSLGYAAQDM